MALICARFSALRARLARAQTVKASLLLAALGFLTLALLLLSLRILVHGVEAANHAFGLRVFAPFLLAGVVLLLSYCLMRVLIHRVPEPEGVYLERDAAPSLYHAVDDMVRQSGAVKIDHVLITGQMNAAIVQRPRWGLLGPIRTYLQIGLPLAHSVSGRQLDAILAHECAHLVLQRKGLQAWACHWRAWAFRVIERLMTVLPVLPACVRTQLDDFVVTAARLSHLEEYEADRVAAQLVGAPLLAQTLVELSLRERFICDDFMCRVMAQCGSRHAPTIRPYREMAAGMAAGFRWPDVQKGELGVRGLSRPDETGPGLHPTLTSRLAALGVRYVRVERRQRVTAADEHLGKLLPSLALNFDRAWWLEVRQAWRINYRQASRATVSDA